MRAEAEPAWRMGWCPNLINSVDVLLCIHEADGLMTSLAKVWPSARTDPDSRDADMQQWLWLLTPLHSLYFNICSYCGQKTLFIGLIFQ